MKCEARFQESWDDFFREGETTRPDARDEGCSNRPVPFRFLATPVRAMAMTETIDDLKFLLMLTLVAFGGVGLGVILR